MKLYKRFSVHIVLHPALMLVIAWLVSGCSGSNEPVASDEQPAINSAVSEADNSAASEANNSNDNDIVNENTDITEAESDTETAGPETMLEGENEAVNNSPVVADPLIQNTVPVTFEITVPFYLSNELRVELIWGEISLTAMWVGGQFWSTTGEFPTETEHPLTITFYDKNGAVELARYSEQYRVGSNATEPVQITAEQFDADQFDSDGDGANNLYELNAGTDPFVDDGPHLELVDSYAISELDRYARLSVSKEFESHVVQDRPYVDAYEGENFGYIGKFNINIDADGNGTLELNKDEPRGRNLRWFSAARRNTGSSISWAGEVTYADMFYVHVETIANTVSVIDENLRSFVQESSGFNNGTYQFSWESSASLTGKLREGTSLCEPVAGTFTETRESYFGNGIVTEIISVSKETNDPYWRVIIMDSELGTTEYFARELEIFDNYVDDDEENAYFLCDFVDF